MTSALLRFAGLSALAAAALAAAPAPARLIEAVRPGLVRVEMDLQFDRGEPPAGVMDQDPGSRTRPVHTLAELVLEERPLETTGFLVAPGVVAAMDPTIHPRFVRAIHVRHGTNETTARPMAWGRDDWMVLLQLDRPLPDTRPLRFGPGKPASVATYYRLDGDMVVELLPFGGRLQKPDRQGLHRVADSQGVALSAAGQAVGLVLSRRLPLDDSWLGSPLRWPLVGADEYQAALAGLRGTTRDTFLRVRLSFRSPSTPAPGMRGRSRFGNDDGDDDEAATERDVLGLALPGNRVLVLAQLKPSTTARLERVMVHPAGAAGMPARFVASLRDFGALVVETPQPLPAALSVEEGPAAGLTERLLLRADVQLQGETRSEHFHHARIGTHRVGPRLAPYPELADMSDASRAFLFTPDRRLVALPVEPRPRTALSRPDFRRGTEVELTPAWLLGRAVQGLPATGDPANVPVAEAEENRLAWLGVELQPLTRDLARANKAADQTRDGEAGALVTFIHPGSPAARSGLQAGDILVRLRTAATPAPIEVRLEEDAMRAQPFPWDRLDEIREQFFDRLPTPWTPAENAFTRALTDLGFGTEFTLELVRGGQLRQETLRVEAGPTHYESAPRFKSEELGLTVRGLTYDV
ncbi:MAG: hypothetical protein ACKO3N_05130, partial [Verrucomicrobiota bacterium]